MLFRNLVPFRVYSLTRKSPYPSVMKKLLIYGFAIIICFTAGCKKDKQNKIYLLQQQIVDYTSVGGSFDTLTYTYDSKNRITTIKENTLPVTSFNITYDNVNRVITASKYNGNTLLIEFNFFYSANKSGYYFHGPNRATDTAYFTFNSKNQLTKIQANYSGSQVFTYDNNDNVETSESFGADGTNELGNKVSYSYDNQKNPFSDMPANNYFFMYVAYNDASTLKHNVVVRDADSYLYTYNTDGFPVSAQASTTTTTISILYNYIIK
ncbi:MAG: hypothetical protein JWP37_2727 [Mucilaginibacter sp.]|nr:hypothetical protein [Mucilaginibacter sp.]